MRRFWCVFLFLAMSSIIVLGCSRQGPAKDDKQSTDNKPNIQIAAKADPDKDSEGAKDPKGTDPDPALFQPATADPKQAQYEASLTEALTLLADRKLPEALSALEKAQTFQDTDFIKGEIAKVKGRLEQEAAAKKTVKNIETVLAEGKADDAAKLAQQALKEFGDGPVADQLVKLRLQAEALQNADKKENAALRFQRFRAEGEDALKEKDLRAAVLAFEQALAAKDDAGLKEQLDDLRASLDKYDRLRKRAADLRRNPNSLEDALDALKEAAKSWDTPQIHQDIEEYTLALQQRRDNVSVADFEIRGDVGLADAGRTFAEELLPHLKPRFDLVERGQVAKVLAELKLEANFGDDPNGQRELGKLAKVRYLVLGSVSRLAGLTVSARLVDVRSGLVVQTGKIVVPSAEGAVALLPELAKQLLMSDEEKLAYEQKQVQLAKKPAPFADDAVLPPVPAVADKDDPQPAPDPVEIPVPPDFGGLRLEVFQQLPPAPLAGKPLPPLPPPGPNEVRVKHRLLLAVVHLGDNLFRRGHYRDAQRQYEFALTLAPGNFDLLLRLERCRPFIPPPVVVVEPVVILPPRQRIAVLNFMTVGDPVFVPMALGPWTAYNLAPYFRQYFDVVDANDVYWYMARMGLTLRDLMDNPGARRWLGRALGVRYFVLGTLQQTASFDATTYMLDAEYGFLQGTGRVHVRNAFELKLRLAELVGMTLMTPTERAAFLGERPRFEVLLVKGRNHRERREFALAVAAFEEALRIRAGNVEVLAYLLQARGQAQKWAWEEERRQRFLALQVAEEAARRRQRDMVQAAEAARIRALEQAALLSPAEKFRREEQRRLAQEQLLAQARVAFQIGNFNLSIGLFQGATGLAPANDNVLRELTRARIEAEKAAQAQAARQAALAQAARKAQRELELEQARKRVEEEGRRAKDALEIQKRVQEERDRNAYQRAFDEAQRLMAKKDYDAAVGALQLARQPAQQIGKADGVEAMLNLALIEQAKGTKRLELEKKLAAERERRKLAEADAKKNQDLYQAALALAQKALADKDLETAKAKYQEAGQLFKTDAVLSGLAKVEAAGAEAKAAKQKALDDQQRGQRVQKLLADGQAALEGKKYDLAMTAFLQAKKLAPDNVDVLTNLTKAEQARAKALAEANIPAKGKESADAKKKTAYLAALQSGQKALAGKKFDDALKNFTEAARIMPGDPKALQLLQETQKAIRVANDNAKKQTDYLAYLQAGQKAMDGKKYAEALKSFQDAAKIMAGDAKAQQLLAQAQKALDTAKLKPAPVDDTKVKFQKNMDNAAALEKQKKYAEALQAYKDALNLAPNDAKAKEGARRSEFTLHVLDGQKFLDMKKYPEAIREFEAALVLSPNNPAVTKLLAKAKQGKK